MAIIAAMIKKLREITGAGMMECKKALTATDEDMDQAIEFLRKKGLAIAQKKVGRIASDGIVMLKVTDDCKKAVAIEVNTETDFVAKNEKFQSYVAKVCDQAIDTKAVDIEAFLAEPWKFDASKSVHEALAGQISIIGENIKIRRFTRIEETNGFVATYTHMGGKIAVLVDVETDVVNDALKEMGKNIAMQVAALNPLYISENEVPEEYIDHEKEIFFAQIKNDPKEFQKSEKIIESMINGRIKKKLKEICLLNQVYVKAEDGKHSVRKYISQIAKENSAKISVKRFIRWETGEGIEKKKEDFVSEVVKQMKQSIDRK